MTFGIPESDPVTSLRDFCALLKTLHTAAGGPAVDALSADNTIPLKRAQIFATLGGSIRRPPSWKFVEAFVRRCADHAAHDLGPITDLQAWKREHTRLTNLWSQHSVRQGAADALADRHGRPRGRTLTMQDVTLYRVHTDGAGNARRVGVITGDLRQVRCADVWVNSENTEMVMARVHEFSTSAIIRYEGARHDLDGRVTDDLIADELEAAAAGHRPVELGSVLVTGAGELRQRNDVRFIVHVAAVRGEPGSGFHPMVEVGRCVPNVLRAADARAEAAPDGLTVLFPLLGSGSAGADTERTARELIHAAMNHLRAARDTRVGTVLFLAHTDRELAACQAAFRAARLRPEPPSR